MSWDGPVFITVAPVRAEVTRSDNPALPHTPDEIVADAAACEAAGAAIVHLHVREEDGTPSSRPELFEQVVRGIHRQTDLVTMVSTGGSVEMSIDERMTGLEAMPDMAGIETGSLNFGEDVFITSRPDALRVAARSRELGIALEVEAFDVGHVAQAVKMLDRGELETPLRVNLVFGVPGGIDASPEALAAMLRPLPPGTSWSVTAIGRHQRRMIALALLNGASGIRVGFEDNVYAGPGRIAESNAELVRDAADLARSLGRRVCGPAETRTLLELRSRPCTTTHTGM